jgi:ribosomal protein L16/L10AE
MLLKPRISKFIKSFRPKLKDSNVNIKGCKLIFGSTGFQASKSVTINAKEIETCRILIRRSLGRKMPI